LHNGKNNFRIVFFTRYRSR